MMANRESQTNRVQTMTHRDTFLWQRAQETASVARVRVAQASWCRAALLTVLACCAPSDGFAQQENSPDLTLKQIMADPDWIGNAPQRAYWADDSESIYYWRKRNGEVLQDLFQIELDGDLLGRVPDHRLGEIDVPGGELNRQRTRKVYSREGDLYVKDLASGTIQQLTRTVASESGPRLMTGGDRIVFQRDGATLIRELESGLEYEPAELRTEDAPDEEKKKSDYLQDQQRRLLQFVEEQKEARQAQRERATNDQRNDPTRVPLPWYLGKNLQVRQSALSPDGRWMLVRYTKGPGQSARRDNMPEFITDDAYVENRSVRSLVGTGESPTEHLMLLDLASHERHDLDLSVLPGIDDDTLKAIRDASQTERTEQGKPAKTDELSGKSSDEQLTSEAKQTGKPSTKPRGIRLSSISWADDGGRVAFQAFSYDNKDRWIAEVDLETKQVIPLERMSDEAWINRRFTEIGWLPESDTLYFISEESGYAHLYLRSLSGGWRKPLTSGEYEVSNLQLSNDGKFFYFRANIVHPGVYEAFRVGTEDARIEQLTDMGGSNQFTLSPDEKSLLIEHSTATRPMELWIQETRPGASARQITQTTSDSFKAIEWAAPEFVEVPSRAGRPVHARVYTPDDGVTEGVDDRGRRPAVIFIHGAGYLQNAHQGWSGYFREFMFHTVLTQRGYVVLDMDYRASAGYGRDWRTAIYRQMGTPEVEDLLDGVKWLGENKNVDPQRVGLYGGSYGGFLTLMCLFKQPNDFACGAALRPVTDWAHYNHGYTSNILNTPEEDPQAYERSSPIEFAEHLSKPLLMCHGMVDDNVFFKDTVRLAQRLIELEKEDWEVAIFPVEPHGFRQPSSWLDEYRRIFKLFETHLK